MNATDNYFKRVLCLFVLVGATTVLSPTPSYGQERERVLIDFSLRRDESFGSCCAAEYVSDSYTVPEGKTLVIEQVYLRMYVPAGVRAEGWLKVNYNLASKRYGFLFTTQGTDIDGRTILIASHPMKLNVINRRDDPPHRTITVSFQVRVQSDSRRSVGRDPAISGYLEPSPFLGDPVP